MLPLGDGSLHVAYEVRESVSFRHSRRQKGMPTSSGIFTLPFAWFEQCS
jgi:hypothetical protein